MTRIMCVQLFVEVIRRLLIIFFDIYILSGVCFGSVGVGIGSMLVFVNFGDGICEVIRIRRVWLPILRPVSGSGIRVFMRNV